MVARSKLSRKAKVRRSAGAWAAMQNVVPGDVPENGLIGSQFFKDGQAVAPTSFFSSAYDAQYHTPEGIVIPEGDFGTYAPQLAASLVEMLESPYTAVIDVTATYITKLMCDEAVFFEAAIQVDGLNGYFDGNGDVSEANTGAGHYRMAWTHTVDGVKLCINGGTVHSYPDADPLGNMTTVVLSVRGDTTILHEFTIMDPVTVGSELQALSSL